MRLQLTLLAALTSTRTTRADPDVTAAARVAVYHDSDATTVTTSAAAAAGNVTKDVRVDAQYLVDAVSSASVDVVSAATARIYDTRHETAAGVSAYGVRVSYIHSTEHDWRSHTFGLGASRDVLRHNLTLGAAGSYGMNTIERDGFPDFREHLTTAGGEAFAAYTLSPRDLVGAAVGLAYLDGFQASPYRFVIVGYRRAMYETMPPTRLRETATLRWNHALFASSALRTHLRAYRDSWGVLALTGGAEYVAGLGRLDLGLRIRGHAQHHADFYRETYMVAQPYMTTDRELATLYDVFAGGSATYRHELANGQTIRCDLDADAFRFVFADFAALETRTGIVISVGAGLEL